MMRWERKRVKFLLDPTIAKEFSCLQVYIIGVWMMQ
jgi:hypothetical protein